MDAITIKNYMLFLDDERWPVSDKPYDMAFVCRNVLDAQQVILDYDQKNVRWYISFDHDLGIPYNQYLMPEGTENTGKAFADWLVARDMWMVSSLFDRIEYYVHSQNPVGRDNIQSLLDNYMANRSLG